MNRHRDGTPLSGYRCITNDYRCSALGFEMELQQGYAKVRRFKPGSTLTYYVRRKDKEGKPLPPRILRAIAEGMTHATQSWNSKKIGLTFKEVPSPIGATFKVKYQPGLAAYALAFFPSSPSRVLYVGDKCFEPQNICYISNVFQHELGHILCLRHTCSGQYESDEGPALNFPGPELDLLSVMNDTLLPDLSRFVISAQDVRHVRDFYRLPAGRSPVPPGNVPLIMLDIIDCPAQTHERHR